MSDTYTFGKDRPVVPAEVSWFMREQCRITLENWDCGRDELLRYWLQRAIEDYDKAAASTQA